jgi:hypothetical protein
MLFKMKKKINIRFYFYFIFLIFLSSNYSWTEDLHKQSSDTKAKKQSNNPNSKEANSDTPCTQSITPADEKLISEFLTKTSELRKNLGSSSSTNVQIEKLVDSYSKKISPAGLSALSAVYMREQFLQLANGLQNDPSINKAFKDFNSATEERIRERKRYKEAGFFKRRSGSADKALIESGNEVTAKMNALIASIKSSSKIDIDYKKQMINSILKMVMSENNADGNLAGAIADRYEGYTAIAKTVRNGAAGAGLIVGGLFLGGTTIGAGSTVLASTTTTLGSTGAAITGLMSSAAVGAAAGAAGGAGYGLLRGEAAMIAKSTLSNDSFMCSLVQEQAQNSEQVYKDALKFAAVGATIGGVVGGLSAAGGIYSIIAQGGGTALAAAGTATSAWGATTQGLESKALFEKASQASEDGNEKLAREYLAQARSKAVEAGLSGVDSVLAGVATAKTSQAFKQSLREAPKSIAQIDLSKRVATELTNKGHEEWRKNYQEQLKAQGKSITEPREKPVPIQNGESADLALSRLTKEGYKGLSIKNGNLVQDINRPASEIVPSLNQKLNGGPAQDYAKQLTGRKIESESDLAEMASEVHDIWMKNNSWESAQKPHLFKKYNMLTADEQIKDLNVVEAVLRAENQGKIPPKIEKELAGYRSRLDNQIIKNRQDIDAQVNMVESLEGASALIPEDIKVLRQAKSKDELYPMIEAAIKRRDAMLDKFKKPIYQNSMKDYLQDASLVGQQRPGLNGKSYDQIRKSSEFQEAYYTRAKELASQNLTQVQLDDALKKFAAEWIYPPKNP